MARIVIPRLDKGPRLVIEDAELLALDFMRMDASSGQGGYDDLAGHGERDRVTRADIIAINTTMRARSPHAAWEPLINDNRSLPWLATIDPEWDLIELDEERWTTLVRPAVDLALIAATGPGRGISVGSKVLHLKRPRMFPVLDKLVLEQVGATESVPAMRVVDHLRSAGRRNLPDLRAIQHFLRPHYDRSLIRILDVLVWATHPAAGLMSALRGWERVFRREGSAA